jgi:hypothetical protein
MEAEAADDQGFVDSDEVQIMIDSAKTELRKELCPKYMLEDNKKRLI